MTWDDVIIPNKNISRGSEKVFTFFLTTANTVNVYLNSALNREIREEYITLGYSANKNAIVIFLEKQQTQNSVKLSKRSNGNSSTASIQYFLNACNIDKKRVIGQCIPEEEIIGDKFAYIIYLNKLVPIS